MLSLEDLSSLLAKYPNLGSLPTPGFLLNGRNFDFSQRSYLMGVLNLSPDSWYRESVCLSADRAIQRGRVLMAQGADVIDVGAESSLAHASLASADLQRSQLLPVVSELAKTGTVVSVETYHPSVTEACLEAGAKILNLTGVAGSEEMFRMVADHDAAVIICFVQGNNVRDVSDLNLGSDFIPTLEDFFRRQIDLARSLGVTRIFIDPGLGFYYRNLQDSAQRIRHQTQIFLNTFRLKSLGCPICHALPHAFECFGEEVRCAEPYFAVLAALGKTNLFRTHEIPKVKAVLETMAFC